MVPTNFAEIFYYSKTPLPHRPHATPTLSARARTAAGDVRLKLASISSAMSTAACSAAGCCGRPIPGPKLRPADGGATKTRLCSPLMSHPRRQPLGLLFLLSPPTPPPPLPPPPSCPACPSATSASCSPMCAHTVTPPTRCQHLTSTARCSGVARFAGGLELSIACSPRAHIT